VYFLVDQRLTSPVLVVGLGRFGSSLALSLVEGGREVLAVDASAERVQHYADRLTHVVQVDTTDEEAMQQLGASDFAQAIVAIGSDIEASVLSTALLVDLGVPEIWGKAISREHGRILERIGAHHVVYPEADMGERVAHLVSGAMLDYIRFDEEFALAKLVADESLSGAPLGDLGLRASFGITVVGIRPPNGTFTYADRQTEIAPGSLIAVAGRITDVDKFARHLSDH
jgi:trk system potassium uptake protein TrkA